MPITIRCPRCGDIRLVAETEQSNTVACSGCNATLRIPTLNPGERMSAANVADANPFADQSFGPKIAAPETQNPYQAPTLAPGMLHAEVPSRFYAGTIDPRLASRWKRFFGSLIDSLAFAGPIMLMSIFFHNANERAALPVVLGALGLMVVVQAILITIRGQSIGKLLLGMQIVKVDTDALPGFVSGVLLRMIVPAIIGQVPLVGGIFGLVDPLFIFGEDRQCLHDKIAGTKVLDQRLMRENDWDYESRRLRKPYA